MQRKKIAIVGVGLIGGSLALQLHEKKISAKLIGVDSNKDHAAKAVERKTKTKRCDEAADTISGSGSRSGTLSSRRTGFCFQDAAFGSGISVPKASS